MVEDLGDRISPAGAAKLKSQGLHLPRRLHSDGCVRKEGKRPHWFGHLYPWSVNPDGNKKRGHKRIDLGPCREITKTDAKLKLREIIAEMQRITAPVDHPMTLREFYEKRFLKVKLRTWLETNQDHERFMFEKYVLGPLGHVPLNELTKGLFADEMNRLYDEGYSKSLIKKFRINSNALLEEAADQIDGFRNPIRKLELPRNLPDEKKRLLSWEEIHDLLGVAGERDTLIIRMLVQLGPRGGEFFVLRRNDHQPSGLLLDEVVRPKHGVSPIMKNVQSKGMVYLPPDLERLLVVWLDKMADKRPEAFLFPSNAGTPLAANNFNKRDLQRLSKLARDNRAKRGLSLPDGYLQGITPRSFRTTCASYAGSKEFGSEKDAQAILRHASPQTTRAIYMQPLPESVKSTMVAFEKRLKE